MQISSRIDLQLCCQCNDSPTVLSNVKRVDQIDRIAYVNDEQILIDLSQVKGRSRNQKYQSNSNTSEILSSSFSQEGGSKDNDLVTCTLKLFAVRDKDRKLIGVINFGVDWKSERTLLKDRKVLSFQKCIDPQASITITARLISQETSDTA